MRGGSPSAQPDTEQAMPNNEFRLSRLKEVRERLRPLVVRTPCLPSSHFAGLYHKAENLQITGSFKIRTAFSQMLRLTPDERQAGVVASSSGNFAQGVAAVAARLGISSKVVMMENSHPLKVERARTLGAEVVFCANQIEARERVTKEIQRREGRSLLHPFDHIQALYGNGSIGLEILEQVPRVRLVVTPISGGGLIGGVSAALKMLRPSVKVWGVQPKGSNATYLSFRKNRRCSVAKAQTIADGLRVTRPGALPFAMIQRFVDRVVVVEEESILKAVRHYFEQARLVVEPSGAVPLAAVMENQVPTDKTVLLVSGGNLEPSLLSESRD